MSESNENQPQTAFTNKNPDNSSGFVFGWVFLISTMFLLNYLCRAVFGPLLPAIEEEFSVSHTTSTRLLFYISLGYSVGMVFSGALCSKVRPKVIISGSLILGGLSMQGVATAPNMTLLALCCFCTGVITGQYFNAGMSSVRELVTPSQWSKAVAIHEFGPNAGFILAPVIAELGAASLGWRGTASYLGWAGATAGLLFYFVGKGGEAKAAPVDFKRMPGMLGDKRLWLFAWFAGVAISGQFGPFSVMTLHMTEDRAISNELAATLLASSRVPSPLGAIAGGILTARIGSRRTLVLGFSLCAASLFVLSLPYFIPFAIAMFLQPAFSAMLLPVIFTMLAEIFPLRDQPVLLGICMPVASFIGIGIMPGILGIFGDHAGFPAGFLAMSLVAFCSMVLVLMVFRKKI